VKKQKSKSFEQWKLYIKEELVRTYQKLTKLQEEKEK
jgi:hypothetical protein